jgi:flagellar protein FlaF
VSKYTSEVIRGDEDIQDLIDVNRMIMQGLSARAETAA